MGRAGLTARVLTVPTIFDVPGATAGFQANCCGHHTPITKMHLCRAVRDQATEIRDVDRLVDRYRSDGVEVEYRRHRFGEHLIVMVRAIPSVLKFLDEHVHRAEGRAR